MSFQEKSLQCSDCGATFTFSAEEQEFFQSRGYTNEPKRCPSCRQTGSQSVTETAVTGLDARCFPLRVPSAARTPKYPLNLAVIGQFTVAIATVKSDQADK